MIGKTNTGGTGGGLEGTALLTVNAPHNVTTTVSKGDKSFTRDSGASGVVKFGGLSTGTWNVKIDANGQSRNQNVNIVADYETTIRFFEATINITYPVGSTVTATLGSLVLRAPNTSGTWSCKVPQAGTWTVTSTLGGQSDSKSVSIASDGQSATVALSYRATPEFTYSGDYAVVKDDDSPISDFANYRGNWKIRFLTSGTLNVKSLHGFNGKIDVFGVGGGANGSAPQYYGGNGGGGGYTKTTKNVTMSASSYNVTIGGAGGATSGFGVTANGGTFNGGSGGGAGGTGDFAGWHRDGGAGGSDGGNGGNSPNANPNPPRYGGKGQGSTTREFGESGGKLYAGGGGGGAGVAHDIWAWSSPGAGGAGGGGKGGQKDSASGKPGTANTGGGGGGGSAGASGGSGGSGIMIIRNTRQ